MHSSDLLPNDRVVLACSSGADANCNKVQVYDLGQNNKVLCQYDLESAHGVVWNESTQRLYAIGGKSLKIYKLKNWESDTPELEEEPDGRNSQKLGARPDCGQFPQSLHRRQKRLCL